MATALDIITGALRHLSLVAANEQPSAEENEHGLAALNDMCNGWKADNIYTGFSTIEDMTDDFILEDEHIGAVKAMLAEWIAADYGAAVPAEVSKRAYMGKMKLKHDYRSLDALRVDAALQFMPSQRRYY